jgi:hypothetical protein
MAYKPFDLNDPFNVDVKLYHPQRESFMKSFADDEDFKKIYSNFEHIGNHMLELCGHPNFDKYISQLINDTRDGTRKGFPDNLGMSIMKVSRLHDKLMKQQY